jgi:hypothetical protein
MSASIGAIGNGVIARKTKHSLALPAVVFSVSFAGVWPLIHSAISSTPSTGRIRGCVKRGKEYI